MQNENKNWFLCQSCTVYRQINTFETRQFTKYKKKN